MSNTDKITKNLPNVGLVKTKLVGNGSLGSQGFPTPLQVTLAGIMDLTTDFSLGGSSFLIKNDGAETISLEVLYARNKEYITTTFQIGWNPELIIAVKAVVGDTNLLWGQ